MLSIGVIPRAGLDPEIALIRRVARKIGAGSGLLHAIVTVVERHAEPADLVVVAVPAGTGRQFAATLKTLNADRELVQLEQAA